MRNSFFLILFVTLLFFSCKNENSVEAEIAKIDMDIDIERFDQLFANATLANLEELKHDYPFMFSKKYNDEYWAAKMEDTLMHELANQVNVQIAEFPKVEEEIEDLYRHLAYYFPNFKKPRVITYVSYVTYREKNLVTDSLAFIAIDNYLGSDHEFYGEISKYIRDQFNQEQIVVDLAASYAEKYIFQAENRTFLDDMVYYGKQLYFKDKVIPFKSDAEKIGYSQEELDWALANEFQIWQYFIDKELLFSTDSNLPSRFINPAPFSKFQLELIDNESPGRIGQYIGWQIVRAYMENNEVSFQEMLSKSPEEIFNNSNFKPRK